MMDPVVMSAVHRLNGEGSFNAYMSHSDALNEKLIPDTIMAVD
ncbi:MAG: hypothetical protein Ta2E_09140 [Mycoplasmoidaceae bacterium]|nr:MAG: hypothetical protein Ta2E_09140 [Mycoplasmoidaceae bacterium]